MLPRRDFLAATAAASMLTATGQSQDSAAQSPQAIRVGVMGLSRGMSLALDLGKLPGVEVAYLCEVDEGRLGSSMKTYQEKVGGSPQAVKDFRRILDDKSVDALVWAPNHWHGPPPSWPARRASTCSGKPCSHNPLEGEWMVAAAENLVAACRWALSAQLDRHS